MKSERGVTITSIMIYVIALTVAVLTIGRLITYFYKNINVIDTSSVSDGEYMKFNSYFTDEVNIEGNEVELCAVENGTNYIIFFKTQNQYTFKNGKIYRGKVKICDNIDSCTFSYEENTKIISVDLTIKGKDYNTVYTVVE